MKRSSPKQPTTTKKVRERGFSMKSAAAMAAAAGGLRRILLRSSASSPKPSLVGPTPLSSPSLASARLSPPRKLPLGFSRIPVELGCVQSLMPLHSVTASALLISKLSSKPGGWAWLSEGFATPL